MTRLSRVARWSAFPNRTRLDPVRVLVHSDTDALRELLARDRVTNVFVDSLVEEARSAVPNVPGAVILGYFAHDGATLAAACWVGSNVVPIATSAVQAEAFARWIVAHWQPRASIFGPAEPCLAIMEVLRSAGVEPHEVRAEQPLLAMTGPPKTTARAELAVSQSAQFAQVLVAAVAMFEEEVGYSPFLGGEANYRRRVSWLISRGYSFSHADVSGEIIFKADLGAVTRHATQIQGVWLNPKYRGQGLGPAYMAAAVLLAQRHAPVTSLYVNSYNAPARRVYEIVGFERVGTFATVLY